MAATVLLNDYPQRSVALAGVSDVLCFKSLDNSKSTTGNSGTSFNGGPQCSVEFSSTDSLNLGDYSVLSNQSCLGCLGMINIEGDTFLCVITEAKEVAQLRPGEAVYRIHDVEFHCLNRSDYDNYLELDINTYPIESDGWDQGRSQQPVGMEHPCIALKKLLSDGTFYFSGDFDLTTRLQDRAISTEHFDIDSFDPGFMWNSHMIAPLLQFRSRLSHHEKDKLDRIRFLTCVIRGFVESLSIQRPTSRMDARHRGSSRVTAMLTLISRLSCRRAGTRFNSRGIDDDGNVANFVETETIVWNPGSGSSARPMGFSYCQVRGSIPIFWEQQTGLLPNQQKITLTRSQEATQPAFDKHMDGLVLKYGAAHIINLLSETKTGEVELSNRYRKHIHHSALLADGQNNYSKESPALLRCTEYDFHAETKGPTGYEAASQIRHKVEESVDAFGYFLVEGSWGLKCDNDHEDNMAVLLQQEGVFRTNCLDCLDRTNLVQGILSKTAIESFLIHRAEVVGTDFWMRHSTLWADNGDALSKIYAGTGALKSSFTRTGKMSLAGAFADARKSATRMYINNFADKDRQNTIDILLGRLVGQVPVLLYDPINDYVLTELNKRSAQYISESNIYIHVGTFNLNGQVTGIDKDLSEWLFPAQGNQRKPELIVIGFQEIVHLSPQQIMATDPARRKLWERALLKGLNQHTDDHYILLRGGQLVGAALLIFVRSSVIGEIKNVEGSLKKTGMSGVAGNKGAVSIRFEYASTRLCFVTAHLAAGFSNTDERNKDYWTIAKGLRFQRNRKIDDHDTIIWLGDFNYRIGPSDEEVRKRIDMRDLKGLYDNDQLYNQMIDGRAFPFYREAQIDFNPTYKYDVGTDIYDTSEKSRIPAWCDRILWKGEALEQLSYGCANIKISDHRPVFATFRCSVLLVDENVKGRLSRELYSERKANQKNPKSSLLDDVEDEDNLLHLEPLPPGCLPAKSTVKVPPGKVLNYAKQPNPFSETYEPDWVKVESRSSPPPPPPRSRHHTAEGSLPRERTPERKLPPVYDPAKLPLITPRPESAKRVVPRKPVPAVSIKSVGSSTSTKISHPPVPKKPARLSTGNPSNLDGDSLYNETSDSGSSLKISPSSINKTSGSGRNIYPPPMARRVAAMGMHETANPLAELVHGNPISPPSVPPRPTRSELMDSDTPSLDAWVPLKPS